MKISLKNDKENIALVKAMGSANKQEAYEAQTAMAGFIAPVLAEVINNAPTISNLFTNIPYSADDNPSIPLDLYNDILDEEYIKVWSQNIAGGMAQNVVHPTSAELKVATYSLDSAVAMYIKYAQKCRLDVVSKTFTRLAQEILLKQERTAANLTMSALANASTGKSSTATDNLHVFRSAAANRFGPNDLNKLFTKIKRNNASWVAGTPSGPRHGLSDLLVSPELMEEIRGMAYNPINTKIAPIAAASTSYAAGNSPVLLPEALRAQLFAQGGLSEFMGVSITEIFELGIGRRFNDIFDVQAGSTTFADHYSITASATTFDGTAEELALGIDRSRDSLVKLTETGADSGSELSLEVDDQYLKRSGKFGFYGKTTQGYCVLDNRSLVGLIV